jgi:hypothetical protein
MAAMRNLLKAVSVAIAAAAMAGCMSPSHGPGGVAYSTGDSPSVGVTGGAAGGAISGGAPPEKEQRGNTPPGVDRDGHGPAAGAIIDPTGAATRGKPY